MVHGTPPFSLATAASRAFSRPTRITWGHDTVVADGEAALGPHGREHILQMLRGADAAVAPCTMMPMVRTDTRGCRCSPAIQGEVTMVSIVAGTARRKADP
ncbi:MAG: hypothetical protein J2P53_15460 [Bradyrhizobiaceae bacterium]|nr:hypothetical protein [Bradyrhizobiaceae bacterium]